MKKKLIALVLLFALFFSTLPQGAEAFSTLPQVAEAKTKQKKLDYSNMPYLDTLIYNKDYKHSKYFSGARKYLKLLEETAKNQELTPELKRAELFVDSDLDYEITHTNKYGPNFYGSLSDGALALFLDRMKSFHPIPLETNFDSLIYELDDTTKINTALGYICLKILQDRNPKATEYDCKMDYEIGNSIQSQIKFIKDNAILPKNYLTGLRKRLSANRFYKLYISNYEKYEKQNNNSKYLYNKNEIVPAPWRADNFFVTPIVIGGYKKGFNPKTDKYLNIFCNANFTYDDAITSPPDIKAYIYDKSGKLVDTLKPSYQYKSDYLGSFIFTVNNTDKYLKNGKYKVTVKMKAKNGKDKLYAEKSAAFTVTDKNVYGSYRRVPIYPANGSDSRAIKTVGNKYFKNIENTTNVRLAYNIYKFIVTSKYIDDKYIKYDKYRSVYDNSKLLYDSFCRTECLCRFSYDLTKFRYYYILRHDFVNYNLSLNSFMYSLGIPPQKITKYYSHYKLPDHCSFTIPFRPL